MSLAVSLRQGCMTGAGADDDASGSSTVLEVFRCVLLGCEGVDMEGVRAPSFGSVCLWRLAVIWSHLEAA